MSDDEAIKLVIDYCCYSVVYDTMKASIPPYWHVVEMPLKLCAYVFLSQKLVRFYRRM